MIVVVWHSMSSIRWFPQKWSPITQNTHMMTRNIVNILPLSLRSSHLTQDVERWNEEHPKKRTSTPTLTNFFWTERQMQCESFKLKEDVQIHRIAPPLICTFSSKQNTVYEKSRKCLMYPKLYLYFLTFILQYRKRSELRNSNLTTSLCPCLQVNKYSPSISVFSIQINGFDDFDDERSSLRSQW